MKSGKITKKANVDVDLTFEAMLYFGEYDRAVFFTGDGDFYRLIAHCEVNKQRVWLFGNAKRTARELKTLLGYRFSDLDDLQQKFEFIKQNETDPTIVSARCIMSSSYQAPNCVSRGNDGQATKNPAFDGATSTPSMYLNEAPLVKGEMKKEKAPAKAEVALLPLLCGKRSSMSSDDGGRWTKVADICEGMEIATADENSGQAVWERIAKIEKLPAEQVYDIEVEGTHNFVGNGIVAHNTYLQGADQLNTSFALRVQDSAGADKFVITNAGRVGIGTTAPGYTLDVNGGFRAGNATSTNALVFDPNTGNVGIGTATPGAKLDVIGTVRSYGSSPRFHLADTNNSDTTGELHFYKDRSGAIVQNGDGIGGIVGRGYDGATYRNAGFIKFYIDGVPGDSDMPGRITFWTTPDGSIISQERMRIDNLGNVGIGTTDPAEALDVNGRVRLAQTTAPATTTDRLYNVSGNLLWNGVNLTAAGALPVGTEGQMLYNNAGAWTAFDGLYWDDATSRLGIGTTNPTVSLHVVGDTILNGKLNITSYTALSRSGADLLINKTSGVGSILLYTGGDTVTQKVTIDTAGNVGVGTTAPSGLLHVAGGQCVTGDTRLRVKRRRKRQNERGEWIEEEYFEDCRIDQIKAGDEILTLDENTGRLAVSRVNALMDMGVKEIYKLTTATGKTIRTTANHPYLAVDGFDDKRAAVFIDSANFEMSCQECRLKFDYRDIVKSFFGQKDKIIFRYYKVDFGSFTLKRFFDYLNILGIKIVSKPLKVIKQKNGQDVHKANFDVEISFDAAIKNKDFDIAVLFSGDSDFAYMASELQKIGKKIVAVSNWRSMSKELRDAADIYLNLKKMPFVHQMADETKKPRRALETRLSPALTILSQVHPFVKGAGKWTKVSQLREGQMIAVAGDNDKPQYERIAKIEKLPAEQVYDIEVEGTHNFVGNGIVAHNTYLQGADQLNTSFALRVQDSAAADKFVVTNAGRVGIGTTAPGAKLDIVAGNLDLDSTTNANQFGAITKNGALFIHDFNYGNNGTVTTDGYNTFIGSDAGNLTMGSTASETWHASFNTGVGANALFSNTTGYANAAFGSNALLSNTTGFNNFAMGNNAGRYYGSGTDANQASSNSLFVGYDTRANAAGGTNEIVIGASAIGAGSNSVVLGNDSIIKTLLKGSVGIGTTSPTTMLEVSGTSKFGASIAAGSIGFLTWNGGIANALNLKANTGKALTFGTDGVYDRVVIDTSGNVGIGTTDPAEALDVNGRVRLAQTTAPETTTDRLYNVSGDLLWNGVNLTGGSDLPVGTEGQMLYNNAGAWSAFSGLYWDDTNSRLGIGTTSPIYKFNLAGANASTDVGDASLLGIVNTDTTANNTIGLAFGQANLSGAVQTVAGIDLIGVSHADGAQSGALAFSTRNAGGWSEKLRISEAGNVGIGTAAPGNPLHVYHATTDTVALFESGDHYSQIQLSDNAGIGYLGINGGAGSDDKMYLGLTSGWSSNNLVIDSAGNVGIGTTAPTGKLTVRGDSSGAAADLLRLENLGTAAVNSGAGLQFIMNRTTGGATEFGRLDMLATSIDDTAYSGALQFKIAANGLLETVAEFGNANIVLNRPLQVNVAGDNGGYAFRVAPDGSVYVGGEGAGESSLFVKQNITAYGGILSLRQLDISSAGTPTATSATGGSCANTTYYYKITAINGNGETTGTAQFSVATGAADSLNTIAWSAVTGATGYKIYRSTENNDWDGDANDQWVDGKVVAAPAITYDDDCAGDTASLVPPAANTTGGKLAINTAGVSPTRRFEVLENTGAAPQMKIISDSSNYSEFYVDATGDLSLKLTGSGGDDFIVLDENLKICAGGDFGAVSCPTAGFTVSGTGNLIVENKVIADKFEQICPTGYVWVPGSAKHGTLPGFCVMKYEAKNVGDVPTSQPTETPWVSVTQENARAYCQALGEGYHLVSEAEWMTIAENIVATPINDIDAGAGLQLATGHTDNDPTNALAAGTDPAVSACNLRLPLSDAANAFDADCQLRDNGGEVYGYSGTGNFWNDIGYLAGGNNKSQLRVHALSNGNTVWDIAGNVYEWTDAIISQVDQPGISNDGGAGVGNWGEWNVAYYLTGAAANSRPPDDGWTSANGIGRLYTYGRDETDTTYRAFQRGGDWGYTSYAGVFALRMALSPAGSGSRLGFRCAR